MKSSAKGGSVRMKWSLSDGVVWRGPMWDKPGYTAEEGRRNRARVGQLLRHDAVGLSQACADVVQCK